MDTLEIVILSLISLWLVAIAVIVLKGWGDGFIAGYNTAGKEEREQYDIKRLRKVVAVVILFVTASVWVSAWLDDTVAITLGVLPVLIMGVVAGIIIANTWCKKK